MIVLLFTENPDLIVAKDQADFMGLVNAVSSLKVEDVIGINCSFKVINLDEIVDANRQKEILQYFKDVNGRNTNIRTLVEKTMCHIDPERVNYELNSDFGEEIGVLKTSLLNRQIDQNKLHIFLK